jgi:hypothetical protein
VLIYETDDSDFADSVIAELERAGIDCYRTGGSLHIGFGRSDPNICIHIRDASGFQKANEILVQQGAAVDGSPSISLKFILVGAIIAAVLVALVVVASN